MLLETALAMADVKPVPLRPAPKAVSRWRQALAWLKLAAR